VNIEMIV